MASQYLNSSVITLAQELISTNSVITDDLSPFSVAFDQTVMPGNGVSVPVFVPNGGVIRDAINNDFNTDGNNTITNKNIIVTSAGTDYYWIKNVYYAQLEEKIKSALPGLIENVATAVVKDVYSLITSANFTGTVSVGWSEASVTIDKIYKLVESARGTGKFYRNGITILMPSSTYAGARAVIDTMSRDMSREDFKILPVYNTSFTNTWVVDKSCIGVGFGADVGGGLASEFEFVPASNGKCGYGIHMLHDDANRQKKLSIVSNYGKAILNTNAAARAV